VICICIAALCLMVPEQFAFATQLQFVGSARQSLSAHAGLTTRAASALDAQLGAGHGAAAISSGSFRPGCLLLCLATAGLALAPKHRYGLRNTKARRATVRCCVAGPMLAPARPAWLVSPPATAMSFDTPLDECAPSKCDSMLPNAAVGVEAFEVSVHSGLSAARSALRVRAARCARRHRGIGNSTPRASAAGRTRSARRAVGARLQHPHATPAVTPTAFDPSRVRTQLQVGLQKLSSGQPRGFKLQSICAGAVELPTPRVGIINHYRTKEIIVTDDYKMLRVPTTLSLCCLPRICKVVALAWSREA